MALSTKDFWRLLAESRLRSGADCQKLRDRFAKERIPADPDNAVSLAKWLISKRAISRYHAKVLLSGRPGPFFYGPYQLRDRLTSGRLAGCFRAVHCETRHPVLLWFFSDATLEDSAYRVALAQLAAASRVVHPCLSRVYHVVDLDNFKFVVFDDLTGVTAREMLGGRGRFRPEKACRVIMQVALATATLHAAGIVHGDIRPDNLWIDDKRNGRLLQLPLSRPPDKPTAGPTDSTWTDEARTVLADYAAPELALGGGAPNALTDIYSIGCTLYELLSGRPPFAGGSVAERLKRHATEAIQPLDSLGISPELAKVVAFTMAKDPALRYQSAAQLAEALAFFVNREQQRIMPEPAPTAAPYEAWLQTQPVVPLLTGTEEVERETSEQTIKPIAAEVTQVAIPMNLTSGGVLAPSAVTLADAHSHEITNRDSTSDAVPGSGGTAIAVYPWNGAGELFVTTAPETASATARVRAQRKRARNNALFVLGLLFALGLGAGIGYLMYGRQDLGVSQSDGVEQGNEQEDESGAARDAASDQVDVSAKGPETIRDDGKTLWLSPTAGKPISWAYLPSRAEIALALRPAELLHHAEGEKLLAALGPDGAAAWSELERKVAIPLAEVDQVTIAWTKRGAEWPATYVVRPAKPSTVHDIAERWKDLPTATRGDNSYFVDGQRAYFVPAGDDASIYVVSDADLMPELIEAGKNAAPLVRELVKLLQTSDCDRLATVLFTKSAVLVDAEASFDAAELRRLYQAIAWLLRDNSQAAALSLHLGENCYLEARIVGNAQSSTPAALASAIRDRTRLLVPDVEDALTQIGLEPYGAKVLIRLGAMLRFVERQIRVGVEDDQVVVNGYLPAIAAHNLALGSELAIMQPRAELGPVALPTAPEREGPKTVAERLQKAITVVQTGDTLEKALQTISGEIGVPIEIQGSDFVSEGITRNNRFDVQASGVPAAEALRIVLLKANPDGKLVYLVKPKGPGGEEAIFVTTRSAAQKRGDKLPEEFLVPNSPPRSAKTTKK